MSLSGKLPKNVLEAPLASMSRQDGARRLRAIMEESGKIEAARWLLAHFSKDGKAPTSMDEVMANNYLLMLAQQWLGIGDYLNVARLLWNEDAFNPEPKSIKLIWDALQNHSEVLVQGAASCGKTYTASVWFFLDWLQDPLHTCIKVVSMTGSHAKRNIFAQMKALHTNSIIQLPGEITSNSIQVGDNDKQGIHLVAIPKGDSGVGSLRGFHPVPRSKPHKKFGVLSRVRALLDEAEEIPFGAWEGVNNMLTAKGKGDHVKIFAASNPRDRNSSFGLYCEPKDGWGSVSIEESTTWKGKMGWHVVRLDGARVENVETRKHVFNGLLTWEGYQNYLKHGDTSSTFLTMARGWFPEQGATDNIIPWEYVDKCTGSFQFYGKTTYCAGLDLAFEGGDRAVMTIGKFGRLAKSEKFGLEVNTQFELPKQDGARMAKEVIRICKNLQIPPAWVCLDRTGNGSVFHDLMKMEYGDEVMGINFSEASTDTKILQDDSMPASELYDGIVTELLFGIRKWMEFGYLKFGPNCKIDELRKELTSRRFKSKGKRVRAESKKEYKARGFPSCDYTDSLSLLVMLVRLRSEDFAAYMVKQPDRNMGDEPTISQSKGMVDKIEFVNFD